MVRNTLKNQVFPFYKLIAKIIAYESEIN
jgi:hypothetical protein